MKDKFIVISSAGPNRHPSKGTREQPLWDEHATFIDKLVDEGFIFMGGPVVNAAGLTHRALLIVKAEDQNEEREKVKRDHWFTHGITQLEIVKSVQVFIDARKQVPHA